MFKVAIFSPLENLVLFVVKLIDFDRELLSSQATHRNGLVLFEILRTIPFHRVLAHFGGSSASWAIQTWTAGKNMPIIGLINHHPNLVCGVDPHPLRFGKRRNFEYFVYLSIPLDIWYISLKQLDSFHKNCVIQVLEDQWTCFGRID